jgi:hypothetical protein
MAQKLYNTKFVVANMTKIVANDKISTSELSLSRSFGFVMVKKGIYLTTYAI